MTPTQRTLAELRKRVDHVAIVEKWNSHCRIRQDLFGFADLISFSREEVCLWQVTAGAVAARVAKIKELDVAKHWTASTHRELFVVGWRTLKPKGTKVPRYHPRIVSLRWVTQTESWAEHEYKTFSEVI
jgi:hypothetical protein